MQHANMSLDHSWISRIKRVSWVIVVAGLTLCALFLLLAGAGTEAADAPPRSGPPGTITVTNTTDGSPGSLRLALETANMNPGMDTIVFSPTLNGMTITLTSSQLVLTDSLIIDASMLPDSIAIDGDNIVRVFFVEENADVELRNLTITNGTTAFGSGECTVYCGGGIFIGPDANLTVEESLISNNRGNSAGGVHNSGKTTLLNTTVLSNSAIFDGGGIRNSGTLTLTNSAILSNSGPFGGGGIFQNDFSNLIVSNSTIAYNQSNSGGGIHNQSSQVVINQSTLANNNVTGEGGAIYSVAAGSFQTSTVEIYNSTLSRNQAGTASGGIAINVIVSGTSSFSMTNSTLAENSSPSTGGIAHNVTDATASTSLINNVISSAAGVNCEGINGDTTNLADDDTCTGFTQGNATLAPLADYGGPTMTHALYTLSDALGLGNAMTCALPPINGVDQRGQPRPTNNCDSGAFQGEIPGPNTVLLPVLVK